MTNTERKFLLEELTSSEACVLAFLDGLTAEQWKFRESAERWSIAENIEHLIVFEVFLMGVLHGMVEADGAVGRRGTEGQDSTERVEAERAEKERLVLGLSDSRSVPIRSREVVRPNGRWQDAAAMVDELRRVRANTIAFARETGANLRGHFFLHVAFGELDGYQWLVLLGRHTARHALQIEQVMADPAFPGSE